MKKISTEIAAIIQGMRSSFGRGENSMEWCRKFLSENGYLSEDNKLLAILIAYDLQAGSYVSAARKNKGERRLWCRQLAKILEPTVVGSRSILEVGVGEATTLSGVLKELGPMVRYALGFDVSWSRIETGNQWLIENNCIARLFVADLMKIPLEDNSIDVVYSSHSLEPNRGKEETAIKECLRVARRCVVLFEPIYELAPPEAQARMRRHGYVEGLRKTAERLGAEIKDYRLLNYSPNPLNPSGVLHLNKKRTLSSKNLYTDAPIWRCPITNAKLKPRTHYYYNPTAGLAYPVMKGIPMLRAEHAIVASKIENKQKSCIKKIK